VQLGSVTRADILCAPFKVRSEVVLCKLITSSFPLFYHLYFSLSFTLVLVELEEKLAPTGEGEGHGEIGGEGG
jgi:hypothetical protein